MSHTVKGSNLTLPFLLDFFFHSLREESLGLSLSWRLPLKNLDFDCLDFIMPLSRLVKYSLEFRKYQVDGSSPVWAPFPFRHLTVVSWWKRGRLCPESLPGFKPEGMIVNLSSCLNILSPPVDKKIDLCRVFQKHLKLAPDWARCSNY